MGSSNQTWVIRFVLKELLFIKTSHLLPLFIHYFCYFMRLLNLKFCWTLELICSGIGKHGLSTNNSHVKFSVMQAVCRKGMVEYGQGHTLCLIVLGGH